MWFVLGTKSRKIALRRLGKTLLDNLQETTLDVAGDVVAPISGQTT